MCGCVCVFNTSTYLYYIDVCIHICLSIINYQYFYRFQLSIFSLYYFNYIWLLNMNTLLSYS